MYVWFLLFRRFLLFCLRALPIFNFLFIFALRCENQSPCLIFVNIRRLWVTIASNTLGASGFLVDQNKNGKKRRKDFLRSGHSSTCAEKKRKSHGIVRETSKQTHCSGLLFPIRYVFDVLTPLNGCDDDVCVENVMLGREKKTKCIVMCVLSCVHGSFVFPNEEHDEIVTTAQKSEFPTDTERSIQMNVKRCELRHNERGKEMIYLNVLLTHSTWTYLQA